MPEETETVTAPPPKKPADSTIAAVEKLSAIGCTLEEIAAVVGISKRQLIRREKDPKFLAALERGRAQGRMSLRRAQWKAAMGTDTIPANITAQIWLGKQLLGQRSFERDEKKNAAAEVPPLIIQAYDDEPVSETPAAAPAKMDELAK
jgi:transcriptional regulator with XRE-family HTH domain